MYFYPQSTPNSQHPIDDHSQQSTVNTQHPSSARKRQNGLVHVLSAKGGNVASVYIFQSTVNQQIEFYTVYACQSIFQSKPSMHVLPAHPEVAKKWYQVHARAQGRAAVNWVIWTMVTYGLHHTLLPKEVRAK